jgi:orotidine-5'-phosphate decarboxylase
MPGSGHAADRLLAAIDRAGAAVCVGIDPVIDRLPLALRPARPGDEAAAEAIGAFSQGVVDAVAGIVPCVKIQSACFERYGPDGWRSLEQTVQHAAGRGLEVILDAKRGDIGLTAGHYAAAAFAPGAGEAEGGADWVTVNGYLGPDCIEPFIQPGRGAFVLVRTSNPGGDAVQELPLADGRTVAEAVGRLVAEVGQAHVGREGYSAVGAVVAATRPGAMAALRSIMPRQMFLVPGFGAQGGDETSVRRCFHPDGRGAIVTASRSVIYAGDVADDRWKGAVAAAAQALVRQVKLASGG